MPATAGSSVDVCIVSYDSAAALRTTLRSVEVHLPAARVLIREHGCAPDSLATIRELVAASPLDTTVSVDETNPGFGTGCNALAGTSTATWLLFLNPDAEVLDWPWDEASPPPTASIVGPHMDGDGETERQSGRSYRIRDEVGRSWLRRTSTPTEGAGFVSGAALLIDRASFERIGGFDEDYFMFYEDIDLCLRANAAGISTTVDRRWRIRHAGGHATKEHFERSLGWSYDSALRFHASRGSSTLAYRAYVVADSTFRAAAHLLLGHRDSEVVSRGRGSGNNKAGIYRRLAGRAIRRSSR